MIVIKQNGRNILLPELPAEEEIYWQERARKLLPGHQVTIKRRLPYLGELRHSDTSAWFAIASECALESTRDFDVYDQIMMSLEKL